MSTIPTTPAFEQTLQETHESYRHLVEGVPAVLYIDANNDLSTNIYTSPQIEPMLGFKVAEWREKDLWIERMHEDDRERVLEQHRTSLLTGEPFRTEYRFRTAGDREVWVRDEAVLVRDEDGEPLFWRGVISDISETKRTEAKLRRSLDALRRTIEERRELLVRLENAQAEERRRIAADIHDDSIQVMSAADLRAHALVTQVQDPELRAEAIELREMIGACVERLRHLLFELRPPALDREGLAAAISAYSNGTQPVPTIVNGLSIEPASDVRATLFRIAQEALTNAHRHAAASAITLSLSEPDGGVALVVSDDGNGFDVTSIATPEPGHIGLRTMIERAELAGGRCSVESAPGRGTTVSVWLPRSVTRAS
jgi:PAS domain S-box-containing protein